MRAIVQELDIVNVRSCSLVFIDVPTQNNNNFERCAYGLGNLCSLTYNYVQEWEKEWKSRASECKAPEAKTLFIVISEVPILFCGSYRLVSDLTDLINRIV